MAELTELEGSVLGVIAREGQCTRYRIRSVFQASRSHHWRASAGAVYPLLARLEAGGLLRSAAVPGDGRASRRVALTARGHAALRAWLTRHSPMLAAPPPDPIRTRMHFLDQLSPEEQRAAIELWFKATEAELAAFAPDPSAAGEHDEIALAGTRAQLAARRDWLKGLLGAAAG